MKAHIYTLLFITVAFCLFAQNFSAQNIPDSNFADAIRAEHPACIDINNNLTATAQGVDTLDVSYFNISSLEGIEGFIGLEILVCSNNNVVTLPILPASLKSLDCSGNELTSISSLPANLTHLSCTGNDLTGLPVLPATLVWLNCLWNDISILPELPIVLAYLSCGSNQINSLPALPQNLKDLYCADNQLYDLPNLPLLGFPESSCRNQLRYRRQILLPQFGQR